MNLKEDTEEYFCVLAKRRCRTGEAKLAYRAYEAAILSSRQILYKLRLASNDPAEFYFKISLFNACHFAGTTITTTIKYWMTRL